MPVIQNLSLFTFWYQQFVKIFKKHLFSPFEKQHRFFWRKQNRLQHEQATSYKGKLTLQEVILYQWSLEKSNTITRESNGNYSFPCCIVFPVSSFTTWHGTKWHPLKTIENLKPKKVGLGLSIESRAPNFEKGVVKLLSAFHNFKNWSVSLSSVLLTSL